MQAICGYIRLDGAPVRAEAIATLNAHLCPNERLTTRPHAWVRGSAAFGQVCWGGRLPEPAQAIFHDPLSGCTVVADARLDERRALAVTLGLDEVPDTAELILRAWLRWGPDCAERLRGDFVFAVWDERVRRLYLARDITGIRPIHVHYQPGKLVAFATRALALVTLPEVPDALNEGRIADALVSRLEGIDKTSTFFAAVQRLPPSHWAQFTPADRRAAEYWRPEPGRIALPRGNRAWAEALTAVLETAVGAHLDGDQRVGCMLSGGMDSSSLAVIAADQLRAAGRAPLQTFSSVSDDPDEPETHAVHAMLAYPGLDPTLIDPQRMGAMRAELVRASRESDEPFDANMMVLRAQYLAASEAGMDALIDGGSGDMLFLDGPVIPGQIRHGRWLGAWRNIRGLQRTYSGLGGWRFPVSLVRSALLPDPVWRRLRYGLAPAKRADTVLQGSLLAPDFAHRVDLGDRLRRLETWFVDAARQAAPECAARMLMHPYNLCGTERYHRLAAWYGVQPRSPFDHRDVLDLCVNLPDDQRLRDGWTKAVLRDAMRGRMPEPVRQRRGKQHLGWGLATGILLADAPAIGEELRAAAAAFPQWLDGSRVEALAGRIALGSTSNDDREQALDVLFLARWQQRYAQIRSTR